MRLGNINVSNGLRYLLSASNESIVADVQGYEVFDPTMAIRYQQPLPANSGLPAASSPSNSGDNLNLNMLLLVALAILGVGSVLAIKMAKLGNSSEKGITKENTQIPETTEKLQESSSIKMPEVPPPCANSDSHSEIMVHIPRSDPADDGVYAVEASEESENNKPSPILEDNSNDDELPLINSSPESAHSVVVENSDKMKDIVITSEMEAVMETLTARERAVLKTLIDHGGRMTQAEIRYETGTPKSSLTGILISLERRKLITKKEWGRTNIIELSSWFLSKKEPS
jgi:uncharacterized membrane protein